jgi:hypothetical protein
MAKDEHGYTRGPRHQLVQQAQPLADHFGGEKIHVGRVAAGAGDWSVHDPEWNARVAV